MVYKIDSNVTGLHYAEESATIGVLPGSPVWYELEPNDYPDFGGELSTVARNPINPSRQRKKGTVVGLSASGGFTTDVTQTNLQKLLQGFFFADLREKTTFTGLTNVDGTGDDFEAASGLDVFAEGDLVFGSGFTSSVANAVHLVTAVAAGSLTVSTDLEDETPAADAKLVKVGVQAGAGDIAVDATGSRPALTSTTLDFTTLGLIVGEWVFVGGDATITQWDTAANNGFKRVRLIEANRIEFDKSDSTMVTEAAGSKTIQLFIARVLKNELGTLVKRRSYHLERSLGAPDETQPTQIQSELLKGAVPSTAEFSIEKESKMTAALNFVAIDNEQRTGVQGLMAGTRVSVEEADAFNTSSDVGGFRLSQVIQGNEAPTPLFALVNTATVTIDNNVSPNTAVGILGAFDVSAGTFSISASINAYFSDVTAIQAVRNNADVTLDYILAKQNAGIVLDMPLVSLGGGKPTVTQDEAITLDLTADAATGAAIDSDMDYTLLMCFFDYLPSVAET